MAAKLRGVSYDRCKDMKEQRKEIQKEKKKGRPKKEG
jgi:hypothetical protein